MDVKDLWKNKKALHKHTSTGVESEAEVPAEEIEWDLGSQPFDSPPLLEIAVCTLQITGVDKW